MITVHKFPLLRQHRQTILLPARAKLLSVAFQGNELFLWAQVDTDRPNVERSIHVYGTGHELMDDDLKYIGTAHLDPIGLVFHVFENPPL